MVALMDVASSDAPMTLSQKSHAVVLTVLQDVGLQATNLQIVCFAHVS